MFGGGPFLLLTPEQCAPLSQLFDVDDAHLDAEKVTIVFSDPSTHARVPGWPLRNLLAAVAYHKRKWCSARLIAYRANARLPSICLHLGWIREESDENFSAAEMVGWERTQKGSAEPSFVDMSSTFDPVKLVDEGVRLNLSLIRWRLVPEINLERFTDLRCLILGSGTLGCNVARGLLAWGVRRIVFVDSSHVSLSNPVRQSLFEFEDAVAGGTSKARAAAERLRRIVPSVDSSWVEMQVPMPGHTVTVQEESKVRETVEKLESLIKNSDVVFLVMDSREARWLPTLLCTVHAKLAISVAMGFDSYVVIRHGVMPVGEQTKISAPEEVCSDGLLIPGSQLGCYFCSDVTAPGNSMLDRTLDQQCTVSRAGISMAAAGMAVELLASVLQHPELGQASARIGEVDDAATVLGATPHQIRAFISRFHQMTPTVRRFERCVACGEAVVGAYREQGFAFLLNALNDPKHLEFVSGLEQLQASAEQLLYIFCRQFCGFPAFVASVHVGILFLLQTFIYLSQLRRHQMSHLNVREHECAHCAAKFVQRTHLLTHIARKHVAEPTADQKCLQPCVSSGLTAETDAASRLKRVQCTECAALFESQWHLTRHRNPGEKREKGSEKEREELFKVFFRAIDHIPLSIRLKPIFSVAVMSSSYMSSHILVKEDCYVFFATPSSSSARRSSHKSYWLHVYNMPIWELQLDRHIARSHDVRRSCASCAEHFSAITQYCSHMRIIHAETTCAYCGSEDTSKAHREAKHWRRLSKPRPLSVHTQGMKADQGPILKMVILLGDQSANNGGLVDVHKGFPPGLVDAFPGLTDLQIRVTDFTVDETMQSIILSFPVEAGAEDDPQVAHFLHTPIYIDFRNQS
ncbi:unnamed protein product [Toxocara canis]|uniref:Ubiquitin-like modifier-activating enzyme ATG7 n=1 Tax=Toxocara canis TaxID=6265 RepID=A0A183UDH7_TOXCA|nr:unnamed protein product [Toxocara canis]